MSEHITEAGPDILAALRRAHDASVVEFTYTKKNGDVSHRRLVVQTLGEEKVLGWDLDAKGVRSFAISGITELLTAAPVEIDLAPLAESVQKIDAAEEREKSSANKDEYHDAVTEGKQARSALVYEVRKLLGGIVVVPVETDEEPPL